jgi:hypothetical protein
MVGQQQPGARIVRFSDSLGRLELVVRHATPRIALVSAILQEPSIATGIDKRSCVEEWLRREFFNDIVGGGVSLAPAVRITSCFRS